MRPTQTGFQRTLRGLARNQYLRAIAIVGFTLLVGLAIRDRLKTIDVVMLFLLAVVIVASTTHRGPAVMAVALSTALFDFFFVPPYGTFAVLDQSYVFTFVIMFVVALIMTGLTATIREQAIEARHREERASALYNLIRELARAGGRDDQLQLVARHLSLVVDGTAALVLAEGPAGSHTWVDVPALSDIEARLLAGWVYEHQRSAGIGTKKEGTAEVLLVPLTAGSVRLGVAAVWPGSPDRIPEEHEVRTIEVLAEQAAHVLGPSSLTGVGSQMA